MTAEEKLKVVVEARRLRATISEVCLRYQVDHAQVYLLGKVASGLWKRYAMAPGRPRLVSSWSGL